MEEKISTASLDSEILHMIESNPDYDLIRCNIFREEDTLTIIQIPDGSMPFDRDAYYKMILDKEEVIFTGNYELKSPVMLVKGWLHQIQRFFMMMDEEDHWNLISNPYFEKNQSLKDALFDAIGVETLTAKQELSTKLSEDFDFMQNQLRMIGRGQVQKLSAICGDSLVEYSEKGQKLRVYKDGQLQFKKKYKRLNCQKVFHVLERIKEKKDEFRAITSLLVTGGFNRKLSSKDFYDVLLDTDGISTPNNLVNNNSFFTYAQLGATTITLQRDFKESHNLRPTIYADITKLGDNTLHAALMGFEKKSDYQISAGTLRTAKAAHIEDKITEIVETIHEKGKITVYEDGSVKQVEEDTDSFEDYIMMVEVEKEKISIKGNFFWRYIPSVFECLDNIRYERETTILSAADFENLKNTNKKTKEGFTDLYTEEIEDIIKGNPEIFDDVPETVWLKNMEHAGGKNYESIIRFLAKQKNVSVLDFAMAAGPGVVYMDQKGNLKSQRLPEEFSYLVKGDIISGKEFADILSQTNIASKHPVFINTLAIEGP